MPRSFGYVLTYGADRSSWSTVLEPISVTSTRSTVVISKVTARTCRCPRTGAVQLQLGRFDRRDGWVRQVRSLQTALAATLGRKRRNSDRPVVRPLRRRTMARRASGIGDVSVTVDEIEFAIDGCGSGRLALIESVFQDDVLWSNMARQCVTDAARALMIRPSILETFDPEGIRWRGAH